MPLLLYAIRPALSSPLPKVTGLFGSSAVMQLQDRDIEALYSTIDSRVFNQKDIQKKAKTDLKWIITHAKHYEEIIDAASDTQNITLLPMKFGTIFQSKETLKSMMQEKYDFFSGKLAALDGKREWAVTVSVDEERLRHHLAETNDKARRKKSAAGAMPRGAAYFEEMELQSLLERIAEEEIEKQREDISNSLSEHTEAVQSNAPLSREMLLLAGKESGERRMVLNTACLVRREREQEFRGQIDILKEEGEAFTISCTGPWPPYNFVSAVAVAQ
jgi:hypothetical protein